MKTRHLIILASVLFLVALSSCKNDGVARGVVMPIATQTPAPIPAPGATPTLGRILMENPLPAEFRTGVFLLMTPDPYSCVLMLPPPGVGYPPYAYPPGCEIRAGMPTTNEPQPDPARVAILEGVVITSIKDGD